MIDVMFPVVGQSLPVDHSYELYAALSHENTWFHEPDCPARFAPINGQPGTPGLLHLTRDSRLRIRLPPEDIPQALVFAGRSLKIGNFRIRLGVPQVAPLVPAPVLRSPLVIFKNAIEPASFLDHVRQSLDQLKIRGEAVIPVIPGGEREGEFRRRVLRIHGRSIIGYAVHVENLTADESLTLQERGLGGRTRMGCGFFFPMASSGN
jgi:CRISPR-associated protein Cas6